MAYSIYMLSALRHALKLFFRYLPLVQLLILFGCDPSAEDDCGHNALYYALKRGNPRIVEEIFDALTKPLSLMRLCR